MESVIVAFVMVVMLGGALKVVISGNRAQSLGVANSNVDTQVSRSVARIAWALTGSGLGTLDPRPTSPASSSTLTYQRATSFVGGNIVWGTPSRIEFRLEAGELDDGLDNDNDGLVDEGQVVWIENADLPDEQEVVIVHKVRRRLEGEVFNGLDDNGNGLIDEEGLCFVLDGRSLTIRLTLEQLGPEGRMITRTSETTVKLRNPDL